MPEAPNLVPLEQPKTPEIPASPDVAMHKNPQEQPTSSSSSHTASARSSTSDNTTQADADAERLKQIEEILARNLDDHFASMSQPEQNRFKVEGEKIAIQIKTLFDAGKATFKKLIDLIVHWLQLIPGVNRFFLEKEAKKRADELLRIHHQANSPLALFGAILAQAGLFDPSQGGNTGSLNQVDFFSDIVPALFIGLIVAGIIVAMIFIARMILRARQDFGPESHQVTLKLSIPKEQQMKDKTGDASIEQIRAQIAISETFLSTIGGLKEESGLRAWFFGRSDHFSFEIVAHDSLIYFYVNVPVRYQHLIEQQLQAQYHSVQVEEVEDYNFFKPKDVVVGAYMQFTQPYSYPFKTYREIESDPLNALLNPLTKVGNGAGAAIQYVVRSAKADWRVASKKHGKKLSEGNKGGKDVFSQVGNVLSYGMGKSPDKKDEKPYTPTPMEQELIKKIDEKQTRAGLDCNVRIVVSASTDAVADIVLKNLVSSYGQYSLYQFGNSFKGEIPSKPNKLVKQFIYRSFDEKRRLLVNTEELASIWHLPTAYTEMPNIKWLTSRTSPPPTNMPDEGIALGFNMYRRKRTEVRLKREDRRRHMYVIGMTGTGKSTQLSNMASLDAKAGEGICVMDPHGELADKIIGTIPQERIDDVVYFDPADTGRPIGLNMLEFDPKFPEQKTFVINEFIAILDRLYNLKETGGPMFESYLRNSILLNMAHPESGNTILEISKVLADENFRAFKISKCDNKPVVDFWVKEAQKAGGEAALANMVPYITSKLNQFIGNDIMRPIISQQKSSLNFREIMDSQKILLINLSKGKLGQMNSDLIGMIVMGKLLMAALSRVDTPERDRKDFYVYLDEFQNFLTDTIEVILAEARKYRLVLHMAHQYVGQLVVNGNNGIKDAIFGNVGTKICYRIGVDDAELLTKEYEPVFNQFDLMNIDKFNAYCKLMIDNAAARPFNMQAYPPPETDEELGVALKEISRLMYGRDREIIEREIRSRSID